MIHESNPADVRPNYGEGLPIIRLAADRELVDRNPELIIAAGEGINDVRVLMGQWQGIDSALVEQCDSLSEVEGMLLNDRGQVQAEELLTAISTYGLASDQEPAFVLIGKDLAARNTSFVFGITRKTEGASLQSTFRFEASMHDPVALKRVIRHIARHEYGHLVGLDESTIRQPDSRGGIYSGHCRNECTMQQVMSVKETDQLSQRLQHKSHGGFCSDCSNTLEQLGTRLHR